MAIIIGDIHGDINKVRAFLAFKPQVEHVCLGDLVDARKSGITLDDELACLDLIFSSETVTLWGNHDLTYTPEMPWRCHTEHSILDSSYIDKYLPGSGYLQACYEECDGYLYARHIFTDQFIKQRHRMKAAYAVDGWLCTHAGISPGVAKIIPQNVIASNNPEILASWLNEEFLRELPAPIYRTGEGPQRYGYGPLFNVPYCRGGADFFGGIFWFDSFGEQTEPSPAVGRQIFGHSAVPYPEVTESWINLNSFEDGIWVYDTEVAALRNLGEVAPLK